MTQVRRSKQLPFAAAAFAVVVAMVLVILAPAGDLAASPEGSPGARGVGDLYFPELGNGGYAVEHYRLDLTWGADERYLAGVTTIRAVTTQNLSRFNLDLVGMEVEAVTVDRRPAAFERAGRELVITPDQVIEQGQRFVTEVTYHGHPTPIRMGTDLFALGWQTRGREAYVVSEPGGAATFFPVNDHPSDKATFTVRVTAPNDQTVAANGRLARREEVGEGATAWTYEVRDPMASYLLQVAIGDYELVDGGTVEGVVLRHAFHRRWATEGRVATETTAAMIRFLAGVFGPYPFEAYGVLVVDDDLGFALETQTLTVMGRELVVQGRGADITLLHELAHQWFGNSVSVAGWNDIWLNEGFATYAEWIYQERSGGPTAAALAQQAAAEEGLNIPPGDPGRDELFAPSVYLRGGRTLQALRETVGDGAFFEILRTWVSERAGANGSTADFIALAEAISGQRLGDLFQSWLYNPTSP